MIKSPYNPRKAPPQNSTSAFGFADDVARVSGIAKELKRLQDEHQEILENQTREFEKRANDKIAEMDAVFTHIMDIQKGDPGETPLPGIHFPIPRDGKSVDENIIVEKVLSKIRKPEDGKTPIIDEEKIAQKVLAKIPTPKEIKINHDEIVDKVFEKLESGKKKLSTSHIGDFTQGLEQTIAPIRSLAAGFRGGGDVIKAGTNITVTIDADGKKVINTPGGAGVIYSDTVSGTIDGVNKSFTVPNTISTAMALHLGNSVYQPTVDFTVSGTTITMVTAPDASLSGLPFWLLHT